jgi:hypothetical protein
MPYAAESHGQAGLPFSGSSPLSLIASHDGAVVAQPNAKSQRERIYRFLVEHGPATDHEIVYALKLPLSTVNARRNVLVETGRVRACGLKAGPFKARRTEWGAVVR